MFSENFNYGVCIDMKKTSYSPYSDRKNNYTFLGAALAILAVLLYVSYGAPNTSVPATYKPAVYSTIGALLPPVIAISLALITKEVYSSLFVGIFIGALLYANGN